MIGVESINSENYRWGDHTWLCFLGYRLKIINKPVSEGVPPWWPGGQADDILRQCFKQHKYQCDSWRLWWRRRYWWLTNLVASWFQQGRDGVVWSVGCYSNNGKVMLEWLRVCQYKVNALPFQTTRQSWKSNRVADDFSSTSPVLFTWLFGSFIQVPSKWAFSSWRKFISGETQLRR